ncbi:MAG: hypothetical protein DRN99_02660 [Thermoproteota archaeon]|nr:MAG: hypothetical protein DRN99_02660 [Candidatus Korarchaeota archaeon]
MVLMHASRSFIAAAFFIAVMLLASSLPPSAAHPGPFFTISVTSDKGSYTQGETATIIVTVKNVGDEMATFYLGVEIVGPDNNVYELPLSGPIFLDVGATTDQIRFTWTIPDNAPEGRYRVRVDCWKHADKSEKWDDDLSEIVLFRVYAKPTPIPGPLFSITVTAESKVYARGENAVVHIKVRNIGVKPAYFYIVVTFISPSGKNYTIIVEPPAYLSPGYGLVAREVSWTIPEDAELGEYKIAVDCIQDPHSIARYEDDFVEQVIFTVVMELAPVFRVVVVEPSKNSYYPGEAVSLYIVVENIGNTEGTFYLSITIVDPSGVRYELDPLPPKVLYPGSRVVFSNVEWKVPANATPGSYAVEIDFISDLSTGRKWKDTFTRMYVFRVSHLQGEPPQTEEEQQETPQAELKVAEASIASIDVPAQVALGEESYLKVYVINTGEAYIAAKVICNATGARISPEYATVEVEPGAIGEAVFKLLAESEGTLNITILLAHGDYVLDTRVVEVEAVPPPAAPATATPEASWPSQTPAPQSPSELVEPSFSPSSEPQATELILQPAATESQQKLQQPELSFPLLATMAAALAVLISLTILLRRAKVKAQSAAHSEHGFTR